MDKALRNALRNVVTQCRKHLEEAVGELLQGHFGIHADGRVENVARLHVSPEDLNYREEVLSHLEHIKASGLKPKAAVEQLIREAAFTHLNRLCAYKMMTSRGLIEDPVGRGLRSRGFLFYLGDNPDDEALYKRGQQDVAYRHYFDWLNRGLAPEIGPLFSHEDLATRLFPPHRVLESVLQLINGEALQGVWAQDETIGWIFQYFTPKELRDKARKESAAPRNSYEMSFRNQFFTPRYVVEFLVDNTLGRTWYEMRQGETSLAEHCRYLAKEKKDGNQSLKTNSQRMKKDPREIKVLDPACGSGHFLLYCFDMFQIIYEEAYADPELGPKLQQEFPKAEGFRRQIPGLILAHNLHGIDIDLRVTQLAALALWLRAQRAFQQMGLKENRPRIERMNLVCAEPMPGENDLLEEFIAELSPHPLGKLIGELVRNVFERMKLAGEAGALVRIEDDIREPIEQARRQWQEVVRHQAEREDELRKKAALFDYEKEELQQKLIFSIADITDESVWRDAESQVLTALREYARRASNGRGVLRRLFSDDAEHGFAFIDICRKKFDVVLMNPPFGDASIPSKKYVDGTYGDTKGDVYKAFVECFQDRLVPAGFLGIISSRAGFFLSFSSDWRERVVLRLYRPLLLADFGMGVLDAMVETAAYVLRSLTSEEDRQLTLQLAKELQEVPTDKNDVFSTKKYEVTRNLKRHQANGELRRLYEARFIDAVEGRFPRWSPLRGEIAKAPSPLRMPYPKLTCVRLLGENEKGDILCTILHNKGDARCFVVAPEEFRQIPNTPFCYWVSNSIRNLFTVLPPFGSDGRTVKQGLATSGDFRFARLWWEVSAGGLCPPSAHPPEKLGGYCVLAKYRWFPLAKGGSYSPYYADMHLVVNWERDGEELREFGATIRNPTYYFQSGLTYPLRTSRFSPQVMPIGTVISVRGSGIYGYGLQSYLGLLASEPFDFLIKLLLGRDEHPQFDMDDINLTPIPSVSWTDISTLKEPAINSSHKTGSRHYKRNQSRISCSCTPSDYWRYACSPHHGLAIAPDESRTRAYVVSARD
jgi:Eco57I restriction-modification methylase